MFSKKVNRTLTILLALALCLPGVAQAGGFDPAGLERVSLFARLQEQVEDFASLLWDGIARVWEKEGGSIDPSGKPTPGQGSGTGTSTTGSGGESGGSIDPNG
jgi:hypothetical protein